MFVFVFVYAYIAYIYCRLMMHIVQFFGYFLLLFMFLWLLLLYLDAVAFAAALTLATNGSYIGLNWIALCNCEYSTQLPIKLNISGSGVQLLLCVDLASKFMLFELN